MFVRILAITNLYPRPGHERIASFNRQQLRALAEEHEVRVVAPVAWPQWLKDVGRGRAAPRQYLNADGIVVDHPIFYYPPGVLRSQYGQFFLRSVRGAVSRAVREFRPDVLLSCWTHPDGWAAARLAKEFGLPVVLKAIGTDLLVITREAGRRRDRVAEALRESTAVVTVCRDLAEHAVWLGAEQQDVHVVPEGLNAGLFTRGDHAAARTRLGLPHEQKIVLFVGNVLSSKGAGVLVEAMGKMRGGAGEQGSRGGNDKATRRGGDTAIEHDGATGRDDDKARGRGGDTAIEGEGASGTARSPFPTDGGTARSPFPTDGGTAQSPFPTDGGTAQSPFPTDGGTAQSPFPTDGGTAQSPFPTERPTVDGPRNSSLTPRPQSVLGKRGQAPRNDRCSKNSVEVARSQSPFSSPTPLSPVACYLVGAGRDEKKIRAMIANYGLEDCVKLAGPCAHGDLPDWYRACDLVALPSFSEGIPNVLREAMACGRPFVATNVGGIPEIAHPSFSRLVPPGDAAALAEAIEAMLADPPVVDDEIVRSVNISWEESAARLAEVLESAVAEKRREQGTGDREQGGETELTEGREENKERGRRTEKVGTER